MSVKMMTLIWERAPYTAGSLLVLLALADWANDEGVAWPSMERLAEKARVDKRSAQRIVRQLQKDGMLEIDEGGGRARQHKFFIQIERVTNCHPLKGDATVSEINGDISDAERVTFQAERVTSETETVTPTSPDPLVEPLEKPSVRDPSARTNGSRLPEQFCLTTEMRDWAKENTPGVNIDLALAEFIDYWSDVPGKVGRKVNWIGTWRNRMRILQDRAGRNSNGANQQRDGYETAAEKRARGFSDNLAVVAELRRQSVGDHHVIESGKPDSGDRG